MMLLAARWSIRYVLCTRRGGTETPHPIERIEVLVRTTWREPGRGGWRAELSGRRLV